MNVEIVVLNLAALRAAVFTLSGKNLMEGSGYSPPPVGARVNVEYLHFRDITTRTKNYQSVTDRTKFLIAN